MKLYKRNNFGKPIFWSVRNIGWNTLEIKYGLVGAEGHVETVRTDRDVKDEMRSRINAKLKEGYKELSELYDNAPNIVEESSLLSYLNTHLPKFNVGEDNKILPMLAKTLEDNKPFEKRYYQGQWKINGERCIITAENKVGDMFNPIRLHYYSRKGTEWNIPWMDEVILPKLNKNLLAMMLEEDVALDGEMYIPGQTINNINSYIKNPSMPMHRLLQYWCYDICMEGMSAVARYSSLSSFQEKDVIKIKTKEEHYNNKEQFIILPVYDTIINFDVAVEHRNRFVDLGFEGLILRDDDAEYQFGKRNSSMFKFKPIYDGKFEIVDIVPEGKRRSNLPKFIIKNDINSELFEVTINKTQREQEEIFANKDKYIGKLMLVEYRERSGVKEVPFHAKGINIL